VLSTAGYSAQSGLSSESEASEETVYPVTSVLDSATSRSTYMSFISELPLHFVILSVYLLDSLYKAWSDVFADFMALH